MRESIGVTMSVLCSNIRLHSSFTSSSAEKGVTVDKGKIPRRGSWDSYLTQHASEVAMNILENCHSEDLDMTVDKSSENGLSSEKPQDDIKWMETVNKSLAENL